MRRRGRYITNGALLGAGAMVLGDFLIQWYEHKKNDEEFNLQNYNKRQVLKFVTLGAVIGGAIGYSLYNYKLNKEADYYFSSDNYLNKVLNNQHIKSNLIYFQKVLNYREKLKHWLFEKFKNKLSTPPEDAGSFYKRTAIESNYDLDIILAFKKSSYNTLEEMYYDVYDEIKNWFGSKAIITKKTKAIGITFNNYGDPIHVDIVPGREIKNYTIEKYLNLYVKPNWIWQKGGSFKTNIGIQKKITANKPHARAIIKLLKIYRDRNEIQIPSLIIEQCVVDALSENYFGVNKSITENLLNSMHYISIIMERHTLIDKANTNNNLYGKLDNLDRSYISDLLKNDIKKIEKNQRYIIEIFD